jgi:Zn-dependent M28 family amino/carboxypeptidase
MNDSKTRLYQDVERLTSIQPARNYLNLDALEKAVRYIRQEFEKLDCEVREQPFKVDNRTYKNVIARFGGGNGDLLVVGAHYDVCGDQPGADDNASGVAGLLETARLLHEHKPQLPYPIELVAYCLEEPPYFASADMGSAVHARSLQEQKVKVRAMICYEMIGYFSDEPHSQKFPDPELARHYPNTGNFIVVVGKTGQEDFTQHVRDRMRQHTSIDVQSVNLPAGFGLVGLSDHRNYWAYGIDAVMINDSSFLRNPHYHQTSDTIDTLDFDKMAAVVQGVYGTILKL